MKKYKFYFFQAITLFLLQITIPSYAQVKVGSNPTIIGANRNLEVEATNGKRVNISKDDGRIYVENKPSAALTDSLVLRYTDGELRQMAITRFIKYSQDSQDTDGDGIPNGTDTDDDGDGILDTDDKCPLLYGCASNPTGGSTHGCPANCSPASTPGSITALNCSSATNNGILTSGIAASGVTSVVSYSGGNGGAYAGQTITSTGVTGLTATLSAGSFMTGGGSLTFSISGTPSGVGTASFALSIGGQSCTLTRIINAEAPSNPVGSGTLLGKTCFDLALSNDNAGSCGALSTRTAYQANFTLVGTNTQTYTFTPSGTVSNVRFMYVNTNGDVITAISGGNSGNNITAAVTATVNFNTNLNTLALGLTSTNALKADIYVIYNDGATNNGTDRQIKITTNVKDCLCDPIREVLVVSGATADDLSVYDGLPTGGTMALSNQTEAFAKLVRSNALAMISGAYRINGPDSYLDDVQTNTSSPVGSYGSFAAGASLLKANSLPVFVFSVWAKQDEPTNFRMRASTTAYTSGSMISAATVLNTEVFTRVAFTPTAIGNFVTLVAKRPINSTTIDRNCDANMNGSILSLNSVGVNDYIQGVYTTTTYSTTNIYHRRWQAIGSPIQW